MDIRNNRIFIDGKATNEYVCEVCGAHVSNLREGDIFGEDKQCCSECLEDADRLREISAASEDIYLDDSICEFLYRTWSNGFGTIRAFADYYNISFSLAEMVIDKGRKIHHKMNE